MAWCRTAPSHYSNQCWLIIKGVLWHSPKKSLATSEHEVNLWHQFGDCTKITITYPRGQRVKGLTHWGRVMHICVSKLTNIGSDNVLSPGRRQAIIWTNAGISLIGPLETSFNEMLIEIHAFSFTKIHLKMSSGKWHPFCLCLNVLTNWENTLMATPFMAAWNMGILLPLFSHADPPHWVTLIMAVIKAAPGLM